MFSKLLFVFAWCLHCPHCFHLFTGNLSHLLVVKDMLALLGLGGPEDGLGGVRKAPAAKVRGRVRFFPRDVVEDSEAELLHGVADTEDDMVGAGHPDGAVGFQDALASLQPRAVEVVVLLRAPGFVPVAFVDADHPPGFAGDAAVGEEIGRVGKDHVEAAGGMLRGDGVEDGEAVALVEIDAVGVVPVSAIKRRKRGLGEGDTGEGAGPALSGVDGADLFR